MFISLFVPRRRSTLSDGSDIARLGYGDGEVAPLLKLGAEMPGRVGRKGPKIAWFNGCRDDRRVGERVKDCAIQLDPTWLCRMGLSERDTEYT